MGVQQYPTPVVVSGDPASQTFGATTSGVFVLSTPLSAGVYEITTDTAQSSFTLGLQDNNGIRYTGIIRGGKGYVSVGSTVTKIVVPAGMTYPVKFNIRLGAYTQIAAPTNASATFTIADTATFTFTAPDGATDIIVYYIDNTNVSFATTYSPKTSITIPVSNGQNGFAVLVAKDANGNIGAGVSITTANTAVIPILGGTPTTYTSGATTYLVNTFTGSGTLIVSGNPTINYLVIGGGGAGSVGGGGAGGMITGTVTSAATGSFTVTVGGGGAGKGGNLPATNSTNFSGTNGNNSSIAFGTPLTAIGGGGGGMIGPVNQAWTSFIRGNAGGSGGGGGTNYNSGGDANGGLGTANQGNNGGNGTVNEGPLWTTGAGGGGAGGSGTNRIGGTRQAGNGGSAGASTLRTGSSISYAGGGGGGAGGTGSVQGTSGGGGATSGYDRNLGRDAPSATVNTGSGAGGSGATVTPGYGTTGSGGSGIVIVRVAL